MIRPLPGNKRAALKQAGATGGLHPMTTALKAVQIPRHSWCKGTSTTPGALLILHLRDPAWEGPDQVSLLVLCGQQAPPTQVDSADVALLERPCEFEK